MKKMILKAKNTALTSIIAGFFVATLTSSAFAASNKEECAAAISSAEQMMLTATITNDQLASIDTDLQAARKLCDSDDFAGATTKIDASLKIMNTAAK